MYGNVNTRDRQVFPQGYHQWHQEVILLLRLLCVSQYQFQPYFCYMIVGGVYVDYALMPRL